MARTQSAFGAGDGHGNVKLKAKIERPLSSTQQANRRLIDTT